MFSPLQINYCKQNQPGGMVLRSLKEEPPWPPCSLNFLHLFSSEFAQKFQFIRNRQSPNGVLVVIFSFIPERICYNKCVTHKIQHVAIPRGIAIVQSNRSTKRPFDSYQLRRHIHSDASANGSSHIISPSGPSPRRQPNGAFIVARGALNVPITSCSYSSSEGEQLPRSHCIQNRERNEKLENNVNAEVKQ
ncbi:hypothetical protein CDAR_434351 [Caerostris darwini]|uniref:Uncharacterized protein n=1 Tax=Caerostris darwini TaxID=1538125 RepID=A0AAV4VYM2_9ARAC|nr:hypothetical protein CDAR_434351 [Caerostris darwini]